MRVVERVAAAGAGRGGQCPGGGRDPWTSAIGNTVRIAALEREIIMPTKGRSTFGAALDESVSAHGLILDPEAAVARPARDGDGWEFARQLARVQALAHPAPVIAVPAQPAEEAAHLGLHLGAEGAHLLGKLPGGGFDFAESFGKVAVTAVMADATKLEAKAFFIVEKPDNAVHTAAPDPDEPIIALAIIHAHSEVAHLPPAAQAAAPVGWVERYERRAFSAHGASMGWPTDAGSRRYCSISLIESVSPRSTMPYVETGAEKPLRLCI